MPNIKITDNVSLSTNLALREGAPLLKAGLGSLMTTGAQFFQNIDKPLDQSNVQAIALGGNFSSPSLLSSDVASLTAGAGMNCSLSVKKSADQLLFDDDGFSPVIPIAANQAWLGVEVDLSATGSVAASANGVGVSLEADGQITCATYTLFSPAAPPLPLLLDACGIAFSNFSLATNAAAIRQQPPNTVNETEVSGSVTVAASFDQPFAMNALASANLPFNMSASIQPSVTLSLGTSLEVSGDFVVRCYKISNDVVRMGVYKRHGSTLTVSLTAGATIEGKVGKDDILNALLKAALPKVDVAAAGLSAETTATLNGVVREGLSRSLSANFNAACSAAFTHEAALLYDVELDEGNAATTDAALASALHGNWTALEALPNARRIRNIAVETVEKKRSLTVNLFGFYSATSTTDYLKTSTVLIDESGEIVITDKIDATRVSASTSPYAADRDKLRQALMEDFLCTATYAVVSGKLNLDLAVVQSYFRYNNTMSGADAREAVSLGYALGLIPPGSLAATINSTPVFHHAFVNAVVRYDTPALMAIFFKDPVTQTRRSTPELEQAGREVMCMLLDPADPTDAVRLGILKNDSAWKQMDEIGNRAAFRTIPELSSLSATQFAVVGADWTSIVWWAEALGKIAPALSATMLALSQAPPGNPSQDAAFMKARATLANVLGTVTRNTSAAFVHGWGAAVMFALSGRHGSAEMDLTWNSKSMHFQ
ncbi:MAG TPA: hypothetical protein VGN01_03735 [Acidobacteriaceae bacterium]